MEQAAHRDLWRRFEDQDNANQLHDVCRGVRLITEGRRATEPHDIITLAIAGAEAAEGVLAGLDSEWAVYTPQHAAFVASALFAQITAAGAALEKLDAQLDVMAERGDIVTPEFDATGEARRVADAQAALGAAGQDAYGAVTGRDTRAVSLLAAARSFVVLPAGVHETITAVARLLGQDVKLLRYDHADEAADNVRSGCGCRIELADSSGAMWCFQWEDDTWCLVRQTDGHEVELAAIRPCADPRHLAALIHQAVETPS